MQRHPRPPRAAVVVLLLLATAGTVLGSLAGIPVDGPSGPQAAAASADSPVPNRDTYTQPKAFASNEEVHAAAMTSLENDEETDFIVVYNVAASDVDAEEASLQSPAGPPGATATASAAAPASKKALRRAARLRAAAAVRNRVLVRRTAAAERRAANKQGRAARVKRDFTELAASVVVISSKEDFEALKADPDVAHIEPNRVFQLMGRKHPPAAGEGRGEPSKSARDDPASSSIDSSGFGAGIFDMLPQATRRLLDDESFPLIQQPQAAAAGYTGEGCTVAVLDTGADYKKTDLGPCSSLGVPAETCSVIFMRDFSKSRGDDGQLDDMGHGTNVASIIAKVAPKAKLVVLDVFTYDPGVGWSGYTVDVLAAIEWVLTNREIYNICAINMSFGGGSSQGRCDNDALAIAVNEARRVGILAAIASGNERSVNSLASPACATGAVSVGAVYDSAMRNMGWGGGANACMDTGITADRICCFSNSAAFLTILAPGAMIRAGSYDLGGTSQAAPHVAGAIAVLKAAAPSATPDDIVDALTSTGVMITDFRNNVPKPRLNLFAAVTKLVNDVGTGGGKPGGTAVLKIGKGSLWTKTRWVQLSIEASRQLGAKQMCISNEVVDACTPYEPFANNKMWNLAGGDGIKNVFLYIKGDANASANATIWLDSVPPTGASIKLIGSGTIAGWTNSADVTALVTGSDSNGLEMCLSNTITDDCPDYAPFAPMVKHTLAAGPQGPRTVYLYLRDLAGNVATPPASATISLDSSGPSNVNVLINGGAPWTNDTDVEVSIAANDAVSMCLKPNSRDNCRDSDYKPFKTPVNFTLTDGAEGPRYVYVRLRDARGNGMAAPASASIDYDVSPPSEVRVSVAGVASGLVASRALSLVIAATDYSGIADMCIAERGDPCTNWHSFESPTPWTLSSGDGIKKLFVTLRDRRGNTMPSPATLTIRLDSSTGAAPFVNMTINNGAGATTDRYITVHINVKNPALIADMCVTEDSTSAQQTCSPWEPYSPVKTIVLSKNAGRKTVRAYFRDSQGKPLNVLTADIKLDLAGPKMVSRVFNLQATPSRDSVSLTWNTAGADDGTDGSGISTYNVIYRPGGTAPPSKCAGQSRRAKRLGSLKFGDVSIQGNTNVGTSNVTGLQPDTKYVFRVCAVDEAGNSARGIVIPVRTLP